MGRIMLPFIILKSSSISEGTFVIFFIFIILVLFLINKSEKTVRTGHKNEDWKRIERNLGKLHNEALNEYEKAEQYARNNEYAKVIFHLTNAINIHPLGRYYGSRGIYRNSINDYNGAIEDLNKAIETMPNETLYWYVRAQIFYHKLNKKESAFRDWKKAEQLGSAGATSALQEYFYDSKGNLILDSQEKYNRNDLIQLKNNWIESKKREIQGYPDLLDLLKDTPINSVSYSKLLYCFEWQYKRLKILVRDKFRCSDCGEYGESLHVHHNLLFERFSAMGNR